MAFHVFICSRCGEYESKEWVSSHLAKYFSIAETMSMYKYCPACTRNTKFVDKDGEEEFKEGDHSPLYPIC